MTKTPWSILKMNGASDDKTLHPEKGNGSRWLGFLNLLEMLMHWQPQTQSHKAFFIPSPIRAFLNLLIFLPLTQTWIIKIKTKNSISRRPGEVQQAKIQTGMDIVGEYWVGVDYRGWWVSWVLFCGTEEWRVDMRERMREREGWDGSERKEESFRVGGVWIMHSIDGLGLKKRSRILSMLVGKMLNFLWFGVRLGWIWIQTQRIWRRVLCSKIIAILTINLKILNQDSHHNHNGSTFLMFSVLVTICPYPSSLEIFQESSPS